MSKELEALKELKYQVGSIRAGTHDIPPQISSYLVRDMGLFDIIESALKRLEKIETTTHSVLREDISNKLKAFEIIKEKQVNVPYIIENPEEKDVIWYNARFMGVLCEGWRMLTQEEFDVVRRYLNNEI